MAAPLAAAPDPVAEPIVLVVQGQTYVVEVDDPAWPIALYAREEEHARKLAEKDLVGKRALIEQIRKDKDAERERRRQSRPDRDRIEGAFNEWRLHSGHPRCKLTPERFDMTAARIDEDYDLAVVTMAAVGVAVNPYVIDGERHDDYKTAMKDGESVERYANRCPREMRDAIKVAVGGQTAMAV